MHVSRDNMAQFQFMGASFTSNKDSYLNGKYKQLFKLKNVRIYLLGSSYY